MMGRLLNEEQIIKKNVENYVERTSSEYSRYLESTPTFVTYYQRNSLGSTYDKGLENVEKDIGRDSPNVFNRIEKFPLYGIEQLTMNLNKDDHGMNSEYDGEGVILPNSVRPYPEDFFTIDYVGEVYLFKVTNVNSDAIKQKPYYRVDFSFFKKLKDPRDIDEQIDDDYVFVFDNIGTENRPVIKKDDFLTIDYIDRIYEVLYKHFTKYFFNPKLNVVTTEKDGYRLYNRHLNKFIMDTGLLQKDKEYMDSIYLVDVMQEDIGFFQMYKSSIYSAIQKQDITELEGEFVYPMEIRDIHTPFAQYSAKYHTVNFVRENTSSTIEYFPQSFFGRLKIDQIYRDNDHLIENMVIDYIYKRLELTTDLLDKLNRKSLYPDMFSYVFIPIIMYILKDSKNKLIITK
jgi:hypothetical protein